MSQKIGYWEVMMNEGYDDFDYFSKRCDEEVVVEMANTIDMKSGDREKLLSRWRVLRYGDHDEAPALKS